MPEFTDALYEFRVRQVQAGQSLINLFYYRHDDSSPGINSPEFLIDFSREVHDEMLLVQNDSVKGVDIRLRRFGGANEFVLDTSLQEGARPGPPLPSFNAWGYKFNRETIDMRNGSKRVGGPSEDDTTGNEADLTFLTSLEDLALAFARNIEGTNSSMAIPVIYKRGSFENPMWFGTDVASAAYRSLTSQVSRKQRGGS